MLLDLVKKNEIIDDISTTPVINSLRPKLSPFFNIAKFVFLRVVDIFFEFSHEKRILPL